MAWLHAKPKPDPRSRRAKVDATLPRLSRLDILTKQGAVPQLPPNPLPHVLSRLIDIGMTEPGGMGPVPLSSREVEAWQHNTGVELSPWEARLLRTLSREYVAQLAKAEEPDCPAPWRAEVTQSEIEAERAGLRAVLG